MSERRAEGGLFLFGVRWGDDLLLGERDDGRLVLVGVGLIAVLLFLCPVNEKMQL
jgi:hypothetical protein